MFANSGGVVVPENKTVVANVLQQTGTWPLAKLKNGQQLQHQQRILNIDIIHCSNLYPSLLATENILTMP